MTQAKAAQHHGLAVIPADAKPVRMADLDVYQLPTGGYLVFELNLYFEIPDEFTYWLSRRS